MVHAVDITLPPTIVYFTICTKIDTYQYFFANPILWPEAPEQFWGSKIIGFFRKSDRKVPNICQTNV